jgi:hypothetical protein
VTRVSDGSGWFGFANLEPGRYRVAVDAPDDVPGRPVDVVEVTAGEMATAALLR